MRTPTWPILAILPFFHALPRSVPIPANPSIARADLRYVVPLGARRLVAQDEAFTIVGPVPPSSRIAVRFEVSGEFVVGIGLSDGKPLPARMEKGNDVRTVTATTPPSHPYGGRLFFRFKAVNGPAEARNITLSVEFPDSNRNGIGDPVERLMSPSGKAQFTVNPAPPTPRTTFQVAQAYSPELAVPTDSVLLYRGESEVIRSWAQRGYSVITMGGFREGPEYARENPDEVQIDRDGRPLEIGSQSFYLVPTLKRVEIAQQYYDEGLKAGSSGVCPEEPEYWSRSGYEGAFKLEWQQRYGSPWAPPHSGVDARWRSEQLKAYLEKRQIEAILARAAEVKPDAARMLAIHSPVNYAQWGIVSPHYELFQLPTLQEVIGQVWTGTARTASRLGGIRTERTFELAMLEYSSLLHLTRETDKRLWFLMDPVEDATGLPVEDYRRNYHRTLAAALMHPQVDRFEVMPWPQRIYGPMPEEYATEVNTVVGALSEMWRYPTARQDAGSEGIATVVADSMAFQRSDPAPSDFDGFFGLTLPFVSNGVPIDILSLDRIAESGYLNGTRVLLLSYDLLKPRGPEIHAALADWVRKGGVLALFGGTDAYNGVSDSWWKGAGFGSPTEHLLDQLGIASKSTAVVTAADNPTPWQTVLEGDRNERELKNRRRHTVDLSAFVKENGSVSVRFEDVSPLDGWGPFVAMVELRVDGKLGAAFRTGSELETRFLEEDRGSRHNGEARFADGSAFWTYRFDNLPATAKVTLTLDMGNGFLVKARPSRPYSVLRAADPGLSAMFGRLRVPHPYPITLHPPPANAVPLYRLEGYTLPPVWEAAVDRGAVFFCGISPGYLSATAIASRWIRWIGERLLARSGAKYEEQERYRITRGPYTVVRALAKPFTLAGRYVNLLDPTLPILEAPIHNAGSVGFYLDAGPERGGPRLLAASGRLRARAESADETSWLVQAPTGPTGAARLWTGGKRVSAIRGFTLLGIPVPVTTAPSGDSLLLKHANDADGVVIRVVWQ